MKTTITSYITSLESGGRPKGGASTDGGIPSLGAEHLNSDGTLNLDSLKYIPFSFYENLNKGRIKKNDILIVKDGATTGKVSFVNGVFPYTDAAINEHVFLLRLDEKKVYPKYLFYHLYSDFGKNQILSDFRGSTVGGISRGFVDYINLPLPDLKIQQEIAHVLEQADKARQQRKAANALTDHFLQSSFLSLFGDPVKNEKGWEIRRLDSISRLQRGRFSPRPRNDPSYYYGDYPFIQTGDISRSDGRLNHFTQTLNEKGIKVSKQFKKGTIVIAIVGATIGATAILEIDVYATDSVIGISAFDGLVDNYYLEFVLRFWKPILLKNAPEVARPNINLEILNKLGIIFPPLSLQQQFAGIVAQAEQLRQKQRESERELENLFQGLLQKYFG